VRRPSPAAVKAAVAWTAAIPCAFWALLRLFGLEAGFPLVPAMAYTLYVIPVAVVAAVVAALLRRWAAAAVAGVAALALVLVAAPRVVGGPDDVQGRSLRVLASNVLRGGADVDQLIEQVEEQDVEILTLQEVTPEFQADFERAGGSRLLPHSALAVSEGVSGSAVYSRYPLEPGPEGEYETQNRAIVTVAPGLRVGVFSAHPILPSTAANIEDWEEGRGYADAGERMGDGLRATWPARRMRGRYLPVTIDHVLFEEDRFGVRDYEVLELDGSDHRPVYAELVVRR
jgi:endonuclease/exonuclease/phosphatase (EEP) superfamily protein YafD